MSVPGVFGHVTPVEFVRSDGTNTWYLFDESMYRYGFSRVTGVVDSVVQLFEKSFAGAPCTPENTMFQFPPCQLPSEEFRVYHCCWDPLVTVPSTFESAMYPPDE